MHRVKIICFILFYSNSLIRWGQVFILNAIASYQTEEEEEIIQVLHRITPRLQHANHAVVLSAVQVIINQLEVFHFLYDRNSRSRNYLDDV